MSDKKHSGKEHKDELDSSAAASRGLERRDVLKLGAMGVGAAALAGCSRVEGSAAEGSAQGPTTTANRAREAAAGAAPAQPLSTPAMDVVRVGFVGAGGMGSVHIRNLLAIPGAELTAVCDIREEHATRAADWAEEAGQRRPTLYTRGETDFERMCAEEDLDVVYTATPWRFHVPVMVAAMENGKHAVTEVPAAMTIEDCWRLVELAESLEKHCIMMENVNYGRSELLALNLVRNGLLGEVLHAEGGYLHDLRGIKFSEEGEGLWRREWAKTENGNLYPTHGLGPVANCLDINRGDRFARMVSFSSPSRGLQDFARDNYPEGHAKRQETYTLGDVNVSLIQTANGKTIYVGHDPTLPRPYSRINTVQGTKGIFQGYPDRVYVEGRSQPHQWDDIDAWRGEYEHPLWQRELSQQAERAGHGGMDFLEDQRLIYCLRNGLPTDMNVYDAVALSAVVELSKRSVANDGAPQDFPDFTRGRWQEWQSWPVVTDV